MSPSDSSTPPALVVDNVSKRFGSVQALDGVSLRADGEIFGLLGANGAGKSTLMSAILHLIEIDQGTISVGGHDARGESVSARKLIGFLPEEPQHYTRLTGTEFLAFVAGLKELDNAEERREMLAYFGLTDAAGTLIGTYSLGMRKKIGLIAALMGTPRLVLLDEPLNGLDTESMRALRLRIEAMRDAGTTFVISSHVMAFVARICSRAAVLRSGRLIAEGSVAELTTQTGLGDAPFEDVFLKLALG